MNIRTSRIERLRQSRTCAFCRRTIMVRTAATLVVRSYNVLPTEWEYVHPTCDIDVYIDTSTGRVCSGRHFKTMTLYPASTSTATLRMDSAYVRAGL